MIKLMQGKGADKFFQKIARNPLSWLGTAERLKLSADGLLQDAIELSDESSRPNVVKGIAHLEAYMVLTGFAFENLLKGIDVAKDPKIIDADQLDVPLWKARNGHGISTFAQRVTNLSADETDVFERLEEYIYWVGRYPIPKKANVFSNATGKALTVIKESDFITINRLFKQFSEILVSEWQKQGKVV